MMKDNDFAAIGHNVLDIVWLKSKEKPLGHSASLAEWLDTSEAGWAIDNGTVFGHQYIGTASKLIKSRKSDVIDVRVMATWHGHAKSGRDVDIVGESMNDAIALPTRHRFASTVMDHIPLGTKNVQGVPPTAALEQDLNLLMSLKSRSKRAP
ncbi:hypothetical protein H9L39_18737 [Fusarium oxysporum f. sp. albedinis]|nr:hypothetical protein H9L39_18737 [Fusarium oxysporum f. sp. albedinis]